MGATISLRWPAFFFIFLSIIILNACGGGGSGGSGNGGRSQTSGNNDIVNDVHPSDQSVAELQATYDSLRNAAYTGTSTTAPLNLSTFEEFVALIFSRVIDFSTILSLSNTVGSELSFDSPNEQRILKSNLNQIDNAFSQIHLPVLKSFTLNKSLVVFKQDIDINDEQVCIDGGSARFHGTVDDNGIGALAIEFLDCNEGGVITNGEGAIRALDLTPGNDHFISYYNNVTFSFDGSTETVTGSIETRANFQLETTTTNINVATSDGNSYMWENLVEVVDRNNNGLTTINGRLYIQDQGFINVSTGQDFFWDASVGFQSAFPSEGIISMSGLNGSVLDINFMVPYVRFLFDQDGGGDPSLGATLTTTTLLQRNVTENDFREVEFLNFPPVVGALTFVDENVNTTHVIEVVPPEVSDLDGDVVSFSYEWRINDNLLLDQSGPVLPAYIASKGDKVTVVVVVSDGLDNTISQQILLIIQDAPSRIVVEEPVDVVNVGDSISLGVELNDPDVGDFSDVSLVLLFGPDDMVLEDGILHWTAPQLLFGSEQTFYFAVGIEGDGQPILPKDILVIDPNVPMPIARSGIEVPYNNYSTWVANYDDDPDNEILLADYRNLIMLLEKSGDEYVQEWLYPYGLEDQSGIVQVLSFDSNGDGREEPVVITETGIYWIPDLESKAQRIYGLEGESVFVSAAIANLDLDPQFEIAVSVDTGLNSSQNIIVIDLETGLEEWITTVTEVGNTLLIGNVDGDTNLEIISSSGYVYDAITRSNQWYYGAGFGDYLAIGDVDSDGVDEIFGGDNWSDLTLFDAVNKSPLWSISNDINTCSVIVENIDGDPQEELLVGDCQFGEISAYDAASGSAVLEWEVPNSGSAVVGLTIGDADSDGNLEMLWGVGTSSTGEDSLAVAEIELHPNPITTWMNVDPSQLDYFTAAGWGEISPGQNRAVFLAPQTNSGYSGQRIITMAADGSYEIGNEIGSNWDNTSSGVLVDYDKDKNSELFFGTAETYDSSFQVRQLSSDVVEWTTNPDFNSNIGHVGYADMNNDGFEDAVFVDALQINIIDIYNQQLIWNSPSFNVQIRDFDTANLDNDSDLEIIISTEDGSNEEISIWDFDGSTYLLNSKIGANCTRILVVELNSVSAGKEVICAISSNFSTSSSIIVIYDSNLNELNRFTFEGQIVDLIEPPDYDGSGNIIIGYNPTGQFFYSSDVRNGHYAMYSTSSGEIIWSSPELLGEIQPRSAYFFTDQDGKQRATFATRDAMYITQ